MCIPCCSVCLLVCLVRRFLVQYCIYCLDVQKIVASVDCVYCSNSRVTHCPVSEALSRDMIEVLKT